MTITFITNFINHHQVPVADELYKALGHDYTFVATQPIPDNFVANGYPDYSNKEYLLKAYESLDLRKKAERIVLSSDVVIIGSANEDYIVDRLNNNKITFRYSERWFKTGLYHLISPRALYYYIAHHTKYRNKNLYMLCASAYTPNDVSKIFAYPNKCYKWGYFTKVLDVDVNSLLKRHRTSTVKILWVARLLKLKHPELMLKLAVYLNSKEYDFEINMVGSGIEFENIQSKIIKEELTDKVHLLGNIPNSVVHEIMREHQIFCFTSDKGEGWGAVLNEAMSNACCPVASNMIGSVPFLINNGENGLIFESCNAKSLCAKVEYLINHPDQRERMAVNAYNTMKNIWSPSNAASKLLRLCEAILTNSDLNIKDGPCSIALPCNPSKLLK